MLKYIVIAIILLNSNLQAAKIEVCKSRDYASTSVYRRIREVRPDIDPNYALKVTEAVYEASGLFNIDPNRLAAILAQESRYKIKAINHKTHDVGIGQINLKTAKEYGFSVKKLTRNVNYSVKATAIVLKDIKKKYSKKEKYWWTRYNSSNPIKRREYRELVERFM